MDVISETELKEKVEFHLKSLGFEKTDNGSFSIPNKTKETFRSLHKGQKKEKLEKSREFLSKKAPSLLNHFACGSEVEPSKIAPVLHRVRPNAEENDLFRLASLTWSVPVSRGFGRRLRYVVKDRQNDKLIGLIAIGDPAINLSARDNAIGWSHKDRMSRLVNVMDAFVLGALPPYNFLLGGKLIASLLRTRELYDEFKSVYGDTTGIISGEKKNARLLAITTSFSMGRSSVYNRVKLDGIQYLQPVGYTQGYGHFHISEELFSDIRSYLKSIGHSCENDYRYGKGKANWKLRAISTALTKIGFKSNMLKHGIERQVFLCTLADNAKEILTTGKGTPDIRNLLHVEEVGELAVKRWMIPRAESRPSEYKAWQKEDINKLIQEE